MYVHHLELRKMAANGRMSLVTASKVVGGVKEYIFRGIQQLPIILGATTLLFTITTGSVAHANLALGLSILMPVYTALLQMILGWIFKHVAPNNQVSWTRSTSDTCNLVPSHGEKKLLYYDSNSSNPQVVPSYWLMSVGFFIGYAISNAVDCLKTPAQPNADPINIEKRNSHAVYVIVATVVFSFILLAVRFSYMRGCEGRGSLGIVTSLIAAVGAAAIGHGMYTLAKKCGSRASDLFGILSQILPASATAPHPTVCTLE